MQLFNQLFNSLKTRLLLSLLAMVVIVLPTMALIILNSFEQHMMLSTETELSAYSYSILAVAEVEENELLMPDVLLENQFNVTQSGLYAYITYDQAKNSQVLWQSQSLLTLTLPEQAFKVQTGDARFDTFELDQVPHFIYSYAVSFGEDEVGYPLTVHIVKDKQEFLKVIQEFKQQLWFGLAILMLIILVVQLIWLLWTLKPLSSLELEIKQIKQGNAERLTLQYPKELKQVTSQLNQLLDTELKQRIRYRNALSDLAHSLKTPLAVMQAQENLSNTSIEQITRINQTIEHQLKRAQSAGYSSWMLGIAIKPIVDKLVSSLEKIYQDSQITLSINMTPDLVFKGDEPDLLELLGNLLDNAYKAAKVHVKLTILEENDQLVFMIEDDGAGIEQYMIDDILKRGVRADTYQEGHGVGLAIVRDLVESYQGTLTITSSSLGGALFTLTFDKKHHD